MDKPRGRVWHEKGNYDMGRVHFGRVSMSVAMLLALWNIPAALLFFGGGITMSGMYQAGQDYTVPAIIGSIGGYMLLITIAGLIIWGLVSLVKWIARDIRVEGPR